MIDPAALGALTAAGAYLLGSIPTGLLLARRRGLDIREAGSGNIGATNVARTLGRKLGLVVLVLDAAKGAIPTLAAAALHHHHDTSAWLITTAGVCGDSAAEASFGFSFRDPEVRRPSRPAVWVRLAASSIAIRARMKPLWIHSFPHKACPRLPLLVGRGGCPREGGGGPHGYAVR